MNWSNRNALATVLAVCLACAPQLASAQVRPPDAVPDIPDEPLPEWRPPPPRRDVVHLDVAPSVKKAQDLRQAGLWCMSIGGIMMFGAGILWARALDLNAAAGHYHNEVIFDGTNYSTVPINVFNPHLEDERDLALNGMRSLMIIGGSFAAAGAVLFGVGQYRIRKHHHEHPRDPLPPLSGYEHK